MLSNRKPKFYLLIARLDF